MITLVDEVDDLVGELLPALLRMRPRLVRFDGERRVEEEDAATGEGDEVAVGSEELLSPSSREK